ncbi:MAG: PQQ-binding-like beta-propeller repeat protein [Planctomycetota bacterium]
MSGPYERKWWRDFHDEMIATRCEAIVAESKVFVGAFAGNLYALDVATGRTVWKFESAGRIGASPCYEDGRLYVAADVAFDQGVLHCLRAETGELLWKHDTPGGIWTSPACDGEKIYVGDRSGIFHALHVADGSTAWTLETDYMILKPASFTPDRQRIVFGSEDMHVYCVSREGELLWRTPKLPGLSLRDQGATIWKGLAIVRTNPADAFHTVLGRNGELLESIQRKIPRQSTDEVLLDKWGDLLMAPRPRRREAELQGVKRYLKQNRHDQCFFAFALEDGSEPWIAPILYTAGLHNPPTPPTVHPGTGELYTLSRSALTYYVRGVRRYSCLVRLDRKTGMPNWVWPEYEAKNRGDFPMIPDETQALGMMGSQVVGTHQGVLGSLDPETGVVTPISRTRDTYAGIFGPGALPGKFKGAEEFAQRGFLTGMPNEWHGPDRAIVSIAEGRMFWVAGSQVVCIAGPDKVKTESGGSQPPPPFKKRLPAVVPTGNVANHGQGGIDPTITRRIIRPEDLSGYVEPPSARVSHANGRLPQKVRKRLDAEIQELVRGQHDREWAPLVIQLGIGREERHYWRTAETMQIVGLALPHLSKSIREEAIAYLDRLWGRGCPLKMAVHAADGERREPFELGPNMKQYAAAAPDYRSQIADLYAVWAYAHYANRWKSVLAEIESVKTIFDQFVANLPPFDPDDMENDASQQLNRHIGGLMAGVRILERAGDSECRERALDLLARRVTIRVHHERSDHRLVRPTKGQGRGIHRAKVPRYVDLVPELSRILHDFASQSLARHVSDLRVGLPVWSHAYGERMIGGENYTSPPHLSRGLFAIWADGCDAPAKALAKHLDQPWCHADLYYIEKLTAVLRRFANGANGSEREQTL